MFTVTESKGKRKRTRKEEKKFKAKACFIKIDFFPAYKVCIIPSCKRVCRQCNIYCLFDESHIIW